MINTWFYCYLSDCFFAWSYWTLTDKWYLFKLQIIIFYLFVYRFTWQVIAYIDSIILFYLKPKRKKRMHKEIWKLKYQKHYERIKKLKLKINTENNKGKKVIRNLYIYIFFFFFFIKWSEKWKWHTTKYGDPYSEFVLCIWPIQSAHTQQWTHTHREHTHSSEHTPGAVGSHLCCGARGAVGGSVSCSRTPQSWYWRRRESTVHSLPPPTIPAGPRLELATFRLRVQLSNH